MRGGGHEVGAVPRQRRGGAERGGHRGRKWGHRRGRSCVRAQAAGGSVETLDRSLVTRGWLCPSRRNLTISADGKGTQVPGVLSVRAFQLLPSLGARNDLSPSWWRRSQVARRAGATVSSCSPLGLISAPAAAACRVAGLAEGQSWSRAGRTGLGSPHSLGKSAE